MINLRAHLGWSTHGHTAVDVNLYAYGTGTSTLRGNVENTEVGQFIIDALSLNMDEAPPQLRR